MTKWLTVLAVLGLSACQPNDQKVKTVKQRLDEGEVIEMNEIGFRHGGCSDKTPNFKLRVLDPKERSRVVVGKQGSIISAGIYNCYRIGSRVGIEIKRAEQPGQIVVTKITWARLEKVTKSRMSGKFFASSENYYDYYNSAKSFGEKIGEPYVSIIDFKYVKGTAVDEASLLDNEKLLDNGDGYRETTTDGKCIASCAGRAEDTLPVPDQFHIPLLERKLTTWFTLGAKNNYRQGQEVDVKVNWKDTYVVARVKIKKVSNFKIWALDKYLTSSEVYDVRELKNYIFKINNGPSGAGEDYVSLLEFEVVTNKIRRADASCTTLHLSRELKKAETVTVGQDSCITPGSLVNVVSVNKDEETLEIPVRVKARMDGPDSTTTLILERLDGVEQETF